MNFIMKMTVKLDIYLTLVMCSLLNIAICGVCPVSTPTVTSVPRCPATLEEMKEAAQRKKCEMMADSKNCDMPPVYHCLLNQWNNDTIEVCASPWYISGYCAIYNTVEMKVTDDFGRDCTKFLEGKCPTRYHSPEAYKYQNCYNKTSDPLQLPTTNSGQQSSNAISSNETTALIVVIVVLSVIVCILVSGLLIWKYREKLQEAGGRKWPCFSNTRGQISRRLEEEENTNNENTESKTSDSQRTPLLSTDQSYTTAVTEKAEGVTMDKDNSKFSPSSLSPIHGNNASPVIDTSPRRPVTQMVEEVEEKHRNSKNEFTTPSYNKSSQKNSRILSSRAGEKDVKMDKDSFKSSPSSSSQNHGNNASPAINTSPSGPEMEIVEESKTLDSQSTPMLSPDQSFTIKTASAIPEIAKDVKMDKDRFKSSPSSSSQNHGNNASPAIDTSPSRPEMEMVKGTLNDTNKSEATKHDSDINQLNSDQSDGSVKEVTSVPPTQISNEVIQQSENDNIDTDLADTYKERNKIADEGEQPGSDQPTGRVKITAELFEKGNFRNEN